MTSYFREGKKLSKGFDTDYNVGTILKYFEEHVAQIESVSKQEVLK